MYILIFVVSVLLLTVLPALSKECPKKDDTYWIGFMLTGKAIGGDDGSKLLVSNIELICSATTDRELCMAGYYDAQVDKGFTLKCISQYKKQGLIPPESTPSQ